MTSGGGGARVGRHRAPAFFQYRRSWGQTTGRLVAIRSQQNDVLPPNPSTAFFSTEGEWLSREKEQGETSNKVNIEWGFGAGTE